MLPVLLLHQTGSNRSVQSSLQKLLTNTGVEPGDDSAHTPTKVCNVISKLRCSAFWNPQAFVFMSSNRLKLFEQDS